MITVDYNGTTGHTAQCSSCGWESRIFPNPDTAFAKSKHHQCEQTGTVSRPKKGNRR